MGHCETGIRQSYSFGPSGFRGQWGRSRGGGGGAVGLSNRETKVCGLGAGIV